MLAGNDGARTSIIPQLRIDQVVTLRDGRRLAYAEYGDATGRPAFYFHGTPGSRFEAGFLAEAAARHHVRLIAVDRPGFGRSDFKRGRTLLDWPADVAELADLLGIERFAVVGLSGGAPHVEACALRMPERVTGTAVVSGAGPPEARRSGVGRVRRALLRIESALAPVTARMLGWYMAVTIKITPAAMMPRIVDARVMRRKDARAACKRAAAEGLRQGGRGVGYELCLFARPWGFALGDISTPIHLWHGDADKIVPIGVGRWVAKAIPDCRATWVAGGGHLLMVDHADEIVRAVAR